MSSKGTPISLPGVNVQIPFAELLISGKKKIETRTYPCPSTYLMKPILIIETPGKSGKFKKRAVGVVIVQRTFKYASKSQFEKDYSKHLVGKTSEWRWKDKAKWGWEITVLEKFPTPVQIKSRTGIVFSKQIELRGLPFSLRFSI